MLLNSQAFCVILATGFPFNSVGGVELEATTFAFYLFSVTLQFHSQLSAVQSWLNNFPVLSVSPSAYCLC